jgi:hypothetical protein
VTSQAELNVNILNEKRVYWLVDEYGASPNTEPWDSEMHAKGWKKIWEHLSGCKFTIKSKWLGVYDEPECSLHQILRFLESLEAPKTVVIPVEVDQFEDSEF